ncbi:MAG: hypothetical protein IAC78_01915 [Firmicutes bacterium]|uniref:DnaD N-terminal domain-containing protein n=1 Tax=Candidatus Scatoplasma merdavium TaxID=2840932 RepID=A0A9D9D7U7_9BACL|nr:hypothetical protein [Candidatus Scatoplasma merdavium]
MEFKYKDIDWRRFLLRRYKDYKLNEEEFVCLLCIDDMLKEKKRLIDADDLLTYMSLERDKIDEILVSLTKKGFLSFENEDGNLTASLSKLFLRIERDFKADIISSASKSSEEIQDKINKIYPFFEEKLSRTLSGREIDKITLWMKAGIKESQMKEAVARLETNNKKISISSVERELDRIKKSEDILEKGYTTFGDEITLDDKRKQDIIEKKWVPTSDD